MFNRCMEFIYQFVFLQEATDTYSLTAVPLRTNCYLVSFAVDSELEQSTSKAIDCEIEMDKFLFGYWLRATGHLESAGIVLEDQVVQVNGVRLTRNDLLGLGLKP